MAIGDLAMLPTTVQPDDADGLTGRLDERSEALIRVAVLVGLDAPESSYHTAVGAAFLAGVTLDELVATLLAVAGSVGSVRVVSAAPRLAIAAGYDIDGALEAMDIEGS